MLPVYIVSMYSFLLPVCVLVLFNYDIVSACANLYCMHLAFARLVRWRERIFLPPTCGVGVHTSFDQSDPKGPPSFFPCKSELFTQNSLSSNIGTPTTLLPPGMALSPISSPPSIVPVCRINQTLEAKITWPGPTTLAILEHPTVSCALSKRFLDYSPGVDHAATLLLHIGFHFLLFSTYFLFISLHQLLVPCKSVDLMLSLCD